jgi:hypothetical protein
MHRNALRDPQILPDVKTQVRHNVFRHDSKTKVWRNVFQRAFGAISAGSTLG